MMLHLKDSTGLPTGVEGMEEDCAPPPPRRELFKIWWGKGGDRERFGYFQTERGSTKTQTGCNEKPCSPKIFKINQIP